MKGEYGQILINNHCSTKAGYHGNGSEIIQQTGMAYQADYSGKGPSLKMFCFLHALKIKMRVSCFRRASAFLSFPSMPPLQWVAHKMRGKHTCLAFTVSNQAHLSFPSPGRRRQNKMMGRELPSPASCQ